MGNSQSIMDAVNGTPDYQGDLHLPVVLDLGQLLTHEFPPRDNVLAPWLPTQGLAMLYAMRGLGKTWLALGIAYAVASGGEFLGWQAPEPRGVLYMDGEMPGSVLQERLAKIVNASDKEAVAPFQIMTPDMQEEGMPDLATRKGREAVDAKIGDDITLIIVDNISTLARSAKENESEGWTLIQEWALQHRAKGRSVLFIHHAGKGGNQRGTSRREDVLDTVIALRHSGDYEPQEGAKFEVHFEKSRGIFGEDADPFEAHLTEIDDKLVWTTSSIEDSTYEKVVSRLKEGLTPNEIAEELGVNKSTVSRHKNKAVQNGEWNPPKKNSKKEYLTGADRRAGHDD